MRARGSSTPPMGGCGTIYGRFNVAYGAPAPREGVRRREGGTLGAGGYTRVLPPRGYRANPNPDHNPNPMALT